MAEARGCALRISVDEVESQLIAARAGRGLARLLSYQVASDIRAGTLVRVLEGYEPEALPVQLVTPSPRIAPKVRAFLDTASGVLERLDVIRGSGGISRRAAVTRPAGQPRR